ncbi:hypothetical protein [Tenacibaculum sp. 190524A05c]|uniref:hypothetical protein n=1 Tax=Tenacibaculum platacis TaxID=3137852 RepID=UPI0032B1B14F
MSLEKFFGKKIEKESLSNLYGGRLFNTDTNCGTAATNSMGWDKDTDSGGTSADTDKEIEDQN